jgi:hypothetical protein
VPSEPQEVAQADEPPSEPQSEPEEVVQASAPEPEPGAQAPSSSTEDATELIAAMGQGEVPPAPAPAPAAPSQDDGAPASAPVPGEGVNTMPRLGSLWKSDGDEEQAAPTIAGTDGEGDDSDPALPEPAAADAAALHRGGWRGWAPVLQRSG